LPEGALPVYMDTQTGKLEAPPWQMLGKVRKYLNDYIAKTYRPIEDIGAIYSLDLDGL
jgi:hypothetical protein